MNASFEVRILPFAQEDVESIFCWINERSPMGATRWYEAFQLAIAGLTNDPWKHSLAPEAALVTEPVRQALFKTKSGRMYRILFLIVEYEVRILRVRGPGQAQLEADHLK